MKPITAFIAAFALLAAGSVAYSQDQAAGDKYVSKEEYQKLKAEHEQLKRELEALKAQIQDSLKKGAPQETEAIKAQVQDLQKKEAARQAETDQALDEIEKQMKGVKQMAKDAFPGTTKFLLGGYGFGEFTSRRGENSAFSAGFNPIFLWKLSDHLLFEGELELELEGSETSLALEMAQLSYLLNDYMTIGAGKFLNPMNFFVERQHMAWVNKFPDKPLAVYDGLLPESNVGVQLRGGIPLGPTKFEYAFFAANAPTLIAEDKDALGMLEFNNFGNDNDHVAVGGRVGFFPIPQLEVGYGFQTSGVGPKGSGVDALLQSVDVNYVRDSSALKGLLALRAQWVWSKVDRVTYDADESLGFGPVTFNNARDGGYVQLAYRPSKVENDFIKNLETVVRYDMLNQRKTPVGFDEDRWTIGLNYWLGPSTVFKTAYQFDNKNAGEQGQDAVMLQFVTGF